MTFIKYTSDGKAVIQPAALTLSGLDREETLELHTLENAIVLLKQEMEPAEKAAATTTLLRLAHSLMEDIFTLQKSKGSVPPLWTWRSSSGSVARS